jgi:hypothetical protein
VDPIRQGFEHALRASPSGAPVGLSDPSGNGELGHAVDAREEVEFAISGLRLGVADEE